MIAIAGGKGGCGKTTTTLATARGLQSAGIEARAVDLDSGMPNLHRMANVERDPSLAAVTAEPSTAEIQRDSAGTRIVPAPRTLDDLDVSAALDALRSRPAATLLDCPAGAGPAATTPLREADAAILVTTGRSESVEDAAKTGQMARSLGVPLLGAVVTRTQRVSRGIEAELATERVLGVPHSGDPLGDERVQERYREVAAWIQTWRRERAAADRGGHVDQDARADRRVPADRSGRRHCPECGGVRTIETPERGRDGEPTRRRDRRSRRAPAPAGTQSSSRGGGAPSDRR